MPRVPDELLVAVGRHVRQVRQRADLSQEALAERAGLHRNYIGSIERGERDLGLRAMSNVAGGLGLSLAEFFEPFTKVRVRHRQPDRRGRRER